VGELKAQGKDEGEDKLDKRLAIADQLEVGGWVLEIDGDGVILACRFGGLAASEKFESERFCTDKRVST